MSQKVTHQIWVKWVSQFYRKIWPIAGKFRKPLAFKAGGKTRLAGTVATRNLMAAEKKEKKWFIKLPFLIVQHQIYFGPIKVQGLLVFSVMFCSYK